MSLLTSIIEEALVRNGRLRSLKLESEEGVIAGPIAPDNNIVSVPCDLAWLLGCKFQTERGSPSQLSI
ncbi:hypothetical protein MUP79_07165, partial [Candidatus Bathyarchaeota archaeon]|nr:hypothetical protein [Candidatus Bathyarchaeota archaeon]